PQHRRCAEDRRQWPHRRRAVGRARRAPLYDHLYARARRRALSGRGYERQDRPAQARWSGRQLAGSRELLGEDAMMSFFRQGRQEPPAMSLEGVLGPNGRLDDAAGLKVEAPDALCVTAEGRLLFSSGARVMALDLWGGEPETWATSDATVTALCQGPGGIVAAGLAGGGVVVMDASGKTVDGWSLPAGRAASVVDCAFVSADELL